jgi:hypothetical protein
MALQPPAGHASTSPSCLCLGRLPQRYVESGKARILSKTRGVVGLHKNRFCFPLSLCVARLSGVGSDALFIGVMRHEPSAGTLDEPIIRVSCTYKPGCCSTLLSVQLGKMLDSLSNPFRVPFSARLPQFWTTASGIIMCCDNCVTDALGQASAADFIGRSFSSLCTDVGGVNTYLAAAAQADEALEHPTFRTQVRRTLLRAAPLLFEGMCC